VVHGYFLHDSGSGVYVRELARALVRLGHEVTLVCQDREPERCDFIDSAYDLDAANGALTIESPMLGTFYRAEGPGQEPFVKVGDEVSLDTTVCIIEVMKMMNSVPAGVTGTIVEICPHNAELVEYGAPLFRVEPAP